MCSFPQPLFSTLCAGCLKDITYDANGNILTLRRYGPDASLEADYLYLSDGTKLAALKEGSGLIYCGSMVFSCSFSGTSPVVDFESTGFSAGRMVKKGGEVRTEKFLNVMTIRDSERGLRAR